MYWCVCLISSFQHSSKTFLKNTITVSLALNLLSFHFAQTFLQSAHVSAAQVYIFISTDCNDILQCTPCCKINTPMRTAASWPFALHLNNWQQAVLASKGNSAARDCLRIHNADSTRGHWNEEKKQHFTCLFFFFSHGLCFFYCWIKWQACVLYINNNHMK